MNREGANARRQRRHCATNNAEGPSLDEDDDSNDLIDCNGAYWNTQQQDDDDARIRRL